MIVIKNKFIPFGKYSTINLFGILFTKEDTLSESTIRHETIHLKQMQEMLWVFFYLWYAIEYVIVRLCHSKQNDAYHDVSFEEEAHNNDMNIDYLKQRKHFAWLKYIRVFSNKRVDIFYREVSKTGQNYSWLCPNCNKARIIRPDTQQHRDLSTIGSTHIDCAYCGATIVLTLNAKALQKLKASKQDSASIK